MILRFFFVLSKTNDSDDDDEDASDSDLNFQIIVGDCRAIVDCDILLIGSANLAV